MTSHASLNIWYQTHRFLLEQRKHKFEWGQYDCNTLVVEWLDTINQTHLARDIRGQYTDRRGAIRFQRAYTQAPEFLQQQGFVPAVLPIREGDVILFDDKRFWRAHIVHAEQIWSMADPFGLLNTPASQLSAIEGKYTIMRKHTCQQ
jgi:hypothetical protein